MTDCSQKIVDWWKSDSQLQGYIEGGFLDVCCFDVYHPSALVCQHSKKVIAEDSLNLPPFIILNSVLSCLKQEVVLLQPSGFSPAVISLLSSQYEYDVTDPVILPRLQLFSYSIFIIDCDGRFHMQSVLHGTWVLTRACPSC